MLKINAISIGLNFFIRNGNRRFRSRSYKLTSVSRLSFDGIKSVTTCPDTNIHQIDNLGFVKAGEIDAISINDTMTIEAVSRV